MTPDDVFAGCARGTKHYGAPIPWNGSKRWMSETIMGLFQTVTHPKRFFDPFCGSGSVSHVFRRVHPSAELHLSDANPWLVGFLTHLREYKYQSYSVLGDVIITPEKAQFLRHLSDGDLAHLPGTTVALRFAVCLLTSWGNRWETDPCGRFRSTMNPKATQSWVSQRLPGYFKDCPWMHAAKVQSSHWADCLKYAGRGDVVYLDPPYPETLGYGNQLWTIGDLLDLVDWVADRLRRPDAPAIIVSNVGDVARLFTRLGMRHLLVEQASTTKTKRKRTEVLAWSESPCLTAPVAARGADFGPLFGGGSK